ncbi:hypothetical protein KH5H1_53170 [Corallococcus caeni]|uniref:DUF2256 and DUF3253 domain-containing protein n=2 Tax=Corallococcus TaxID=83461 RepID=A0A7Y4JQ74_9BACT|nr:DUF2256 and DUF3253 domain-containing protein [Corallococcus exercitus]NOK09171.1 DUF2256 and DUF3253 domain-containing protein [Corallococcus exercitus]GMU01197.1 hypothetical protein KH5H1_53170 [Corallococcus sp. KH5-1]GMU03924.1 hypothetical protein ASNO1_01760 [Corallococcus sp. NO1]
MASPPPPKPCAVCGRAITWRRKWARDWEQVRYCSDACRGKRAGARDSPWEARILELLSQRAGGATVCPSEVARASGGEDWRACMEPVREAARRLVARGALDIVQGGRVVDPSTARGPIRLRLRT